jgi:hypothetical protein
MDESAKSFPVFRGVIFEAYWDCRPKWVSAPSPLRSNR